MNDKIQKEQIPSRLRQIGILLNKTFTFLNRKWGFYLFHFILAPLVLIFVIFMNWNVSSQSILNQEAFYKPRKLGDFQKCTNENCLSLGAVLLSQDSQKEEREWITHVIEQLKVRFDLTEEGGFKRLYKGDVPKEIQKTLDKEGEIMNVVYFCNDYDIYRNATLSVNCERLNAFKFYNMNLNIYGLAYNQTKIAPSFIEDFNIPMKVDENSILLKKTIDEILVKYYREKELREEGVGFSKSNLTHSFENSIPSYTNYGKEESLPLYNSTEYKGNSSLSYEFELMDYMKPKTNFLMHFDASTNWGSFFFIFIILLSFSQMTKIIAQEKDRKLRRGLIPFGLSGLSHWVSWIIYILIFNVVFTLFTMLVGYIMSVVMFKEGPFFINFLILFSTSLAYSGLSLLIVSCTNEYKTANRMTYTIIVISIFLQIFFCQKNILDLFFLANRPAILSIMSFVFQFIPSFAFSIVITSINFGVGYHIDPYTFSYLKGDGYNSTTFFTKPITKNPLTGDIVRQSDFYFTMWLLGLFVLYIILLWIADNKIESNQGFRRNLIFRNRKKEEEEKEKLDEPLINKEEQEDVLFKVKDVNKIYHLDLFGGRKVHALRDFSLSIRKNEVLVLLGENGAGKSTLISIITGTLKANTGDIYYKDRLFGRTATDKLLVSVCPQYDILWKDLTVKENMNIIGKFRGLSDSTIKEQTKEILTKMELFDQLNVAVGSLSGGMRRRISVGVALMGNAELLVFDEPTTGLDPVNRKLVWEFVRDLRNKGKTVLWTTHIMDEADYLADRIAIINKGKLLRNDTPIAIRNEFNRLNLIFSVKEYRQETYEKLVELLEEFYQGSFTLKFHSDKLIKFNIPNDNIQAMKNLVNVLENLEGNEKYADLDGLIDTFEISSLDLEEAYMLVNEGV